MILEWPRNASSTPWPPDAVALPAWHYLCSFQDSLSPSHAASPHSLTTSPRLLCQIPWLKFNDAKEKWEQSRAMLKTVKETQKAGLAQLAAAQAPIKERQVGSLGDAKSSLGDAKSSLGDAKSSLGDAQSSLGEAKR
jgi:hypothetical protein